MEQNIEAEKKPGILREVISFGIYIVVALIITFLILTFVGQRTVVLGPSMENTLYDQESVIVDKLSYRFSEPKRYDIIVFNYQHAKDTRYIKRVIGLPGETVQIKGSDIYINGEILVESYGREVIQKAGLAADPITLGPDEYFVLGDNRNNSEDSRSINVGPVKKDIIVGKAFLRCWPLDRFSLIKHQ